MSDAPQITDEVLDEILNNPDAVEAVEALAKQEGIEKPLSEMSREEQASLVGLMLQRAQAANLGGGDVDPDDIPDELIAAVFSDPQGNAILREIMRDNQLEGDPADLPRETKQLIVKLLVDQGVISFEPPSANDNDAD